MATYDAIVLGCGGVGSAALFHLARRGIRVLGLDRFVPPHPHGSSHGQTRVIRLAYFEHPDYVPLLRRAYTLWDELERLADRRLFERVGLVELGPPDGVVIPGVLQAAAQHRLDVERWTHDDCRRRLPGLVPPEGSQIVFESQAGYLRVEECVATHLGLARAAGAEFRAEEVISWSAADGDVVVRTEQAEYRAARLVIGAGPWASSALAQAAPHVARRLVVRRKHLHWHPTRDRRLRGDEGFPTFFVERPDRSFFYGFPVLDERGLKVAEHSGGQVAADPLTDDRAVDTTDARRVTEFLANCFPTVEAPHGDHAVCYYTMTPDEHFVVDRTGDGRVSYVAGLSGHGFKFVSVLGEILAQFALDGASPLPLDFLRPARRFGPTDSP